MAHSHSILYLPYNTILIGIGSLGPSGYSGQWKAEQELIKNLLPSTHVRLALARFDTLAADRGAETERTLK